MCHQPEKSSLNLHAGTAVVFQILLLIHTCTGQSEDLDPSQSITAMVGDDITLPCLLNPPKDASQMTVEWGRLDLTPRFVHVWHEGQDLLVDQNRAYKGRVSVSAVKLKHGDASLRLSGVRLTDSGRYRCYVPQDLSESHVDLLVGSVSSPEIRLAGLDEGSSGVMLDCSSGAWWPEPGLLWLDAEGHVLSAGPTQRTRGSDGLHAVSSRVTVQKRPNNTITCRIHQKDLKQSRETHVHVPDDFFEVWSSCAVPISFSVLFCCLFLVSASVLVWRQRHLSKKKEPKELNEEQRELLSKKVQERLDGVVGAIREDLQKMDEHLKSLEDDVEINVEFPREIEMAITQGHWQLKDIMLEHKEKLDKRKKSFQQLQQKLELQIQEINKKLNQAERKEVEKKEKMETNEFQLE